VVDVAFTKSECQSLQLCPVCDGELVNRRHDWLFQCTTCGTFKSSFTPQIPQNTGITGLDECRRAHGLGAIRSRNNRIILDRISQVIEADCRRLLDVGAGLGFLLKDAAECGFDAIGIEPDANAVALARKGGVQIRQGYFPNCLLPNEFFDVIILNDVLEHIPDILGTVTACRYHLAQGGLLVINCPNRHGTFYRIAQVLDRAGILGPFNRMWQRGLVSPHLWYFDPEALQALGERCGLRFCAQLDLLPITLRGISDRISYVKGQSRLVSATVLIGTLMLMPFLYILPRDIGVVFLQKSGAVR
jgi:SAM-dependent methyltransferase